MTVIISFIAALRAGDFAARCVAVGFGLASVMTLCAVMLYRHDQSVIAKHESGIKDAFGKLKDAASQSDLTIDQCPLDKWNRSKHRCEN